MPMWSAPTSARGYSSCRLQEKHELIGDVRGMGLMQAIELVKDRKTKEPATTETAMMMEAARDRGLLIGRGGTLGNVIRMSPPLNISKADVDEAFTILDRSLATVTEMTASAASV